MREVTALAPDRVSIESGDFQVDGAPFGGITRGRLVCHQINMLQFIFDIGEDLIDVLRRARLEE